MQVLTYSSKESFLTNSTECSINKHIPWFEYPYLLWGLKDMLKFAAKEYIAIGELFEILNKTLYLSVSDPLTDEECKVFKNSLEVIKGHCDKIKLEVSSGLLEKLINNLPQSNRELEILKDTIDFEIDKHLFFFVPSNRTKYYDRELDEQLVDSFPKASKELVRAGNCFTVGEYTACVFHSMRAIEIGLKVLALYLNVSLPFPLDLATWMDLINKIEKEIKLKEQLPKSVSKDAELKFCSEAALNFRYFKNAFRNHVAHAIDTYDEMESKKIMEHTEDFIKVLSTRLNE